MYNLIKRKLVMLDFYCLVGKGSIHPVGSTSPFTPASFNQNKYIYFFIYFTFSYISYLVLVIIVSLLLKQMVGLLFEQFK